MAFKFADHKNLDGMHAVLGASQYSWTGYDLDKFKESFRDRQAAAYGTRLHELAKEHILLGITMERNEKTLNSYINDCIGMRMRPEQPVVANEYAFGTADAIRFDSDTNTLYIFDLKTGRNPVKFTQLLIYCVYFCEEYGYRLGEMNFVLRIYQNDDVREIRTDDHTIEYEDLVNIRSRVLDFTAAAREIRKEAVL